MAARRQRPARDEQLGVRVSKQMRARLVRMADEESETRGVDLDISWAMRALIDEGLARRYKDWERET